MEEGGNTNLTTSKLQIQSDGAANEHHDVSSLQIDITSNLDRTHECITDSQYIIIASSRGSSE